MPRHKFFKTVAAGLSALGPGIFLIGYNIGTGSITTMGKAGAEYGMTLFWAVVLSGVFTYVCMVAYGQVTLVTGQTALWNIKTRLRWGKPLAVYLLIALVATEVFSLMGIMGLVAELLQEGARLALNGTQIAPGWIILMLSVGLYALLWFGKYPFFEKTMTFFVVLMIVCFVVVFFLLKPDVAAMAQGLVPRIPHGKGALRLIAAMAGTTCAAAVFVVRSTVVAEKGWTIADLHLEKRDAAVSAAIMVFLSGLIMAVAAGTLHVMGLRLDTTLEMIRLFEPIGGRAAAFILIVGVTGAGLSTVFPVVLIAPWLICDFTNKPRDPSSPLFRSLGFVGLLFCFGTMFTNEAMPILVITAQALAACVLPAAVIPIMVLINRRDVMKEHRAGAMMNIGLVLTLLFSLLTTYFAIKELMI